MAELTKGEQVAYDISAERTKKQAARDRGAADALNGAPAGAVERARARAWGVRLKPAPLPRRRHRAPVVGSFRRLKVLCPRVFFDLSHEDQKRFRALVAEREEKDGAAQRMDSTALHLLSSRRRWIHQHQPLGARLSGRPTITPVGASAFLFGPPCGMHSLIRRIA